MNKDDFPEWEDYCAGCGYLNCRCKEPHEYDPNSLGFCNHCGLGSNASAHGYEKGEPYESV